MTKSTFLVPTASLINFKQRNHTRGGNYSESWEENTFLTTEITNSIIYWSEDAIAAISSNELLL